MSKKVSNKKPGKKPGKRTKVSTIWKKVREDLARAEASGLEYTAEKYFVTFNRKHNATLQFGTIFTQGIIARVAVDSSPSSIFIENTAYGGGHDRDYECLRNDDGYDEGGVVSFEKLSGKNILMATRAHALTVAVVLCERWREARVKLS